MFRENKTESNLFFVELEIKLKHVQAKFLSYIELIARMFIAHDFTFSEILMFMFFC